MPTIVAANQSSVMINNTPVDGVRAIEYHHQQTRENIYAMGSSERIGIITGPQLVNGRISFVSTSAELNALTSDTSFDLVANLRHGSTTFTVSFHECYLISKHFNLGVGGTGEAEYEFTATRVIEEISSAAAA